MGVPFGTLDALGRNVPQKGLGNEETQKSSHRRVTTIGVRTLETKLRA